MGYLLIPLVVPPFAGFLALYVSDRSSDKAHSKALMAFVVRMPGKELAESDVIDCATSKITPIKALSKVKFVDVLPKSLVGKILKKELRKMV
jgi:long-chain acyl-CoA synthetase